MTDGRREMSPELDSTAAVLSLTVVRDGIGIRVAADGEVDMSTADNLRDCLDELLDQKPDKLTVDLAGVTFLDSSGIATLVHAYNRATKQDAGLNVVNCRRNVRRVLELTGLLSVMSDGT
ncbi:STAS domain-containing protein [Plantactinospora sp. KLBMP9567]|uniref:STAS domain-containing protein n=1 Tax=Plantactinospora sp. KLBMP9567 TaxID=3085900 RepID=UPI0029822B04|nr:STAS domain-containing protein [Plantactinospora sp. KLBMP9567]MDW5322414.1 STAS domain-containing protein [Plantactinospora sp. KLBMP9567]